MAVDVNALVVKQNDLIQKSRFNLSLVQQKIILYLISQISPMDEEFKLYEFSIGEFCRIAGIENRSGRQYIELKQAIKEIADKSLWVEIAEDEETLVRWIEKPYINKRSGTIKIRLDKDMKPFLLQMKKNFTQYELVYTLNFKSKYTIRLYELLKSVHFHELDVYERAYSLAEIKKRMGAERYSTYKDFRVRALDPAVKEINQFSDKNVEYAAIKTGRSVTGIKLTISTKPAEERLRIRDNVEKELGYEQIALF